MAPGAHVDNETMEHHVRKYKMASTKVAAYTLIVLLTSIALGQSKSDPALQSVDKIVGRMHERERLQWANLRNYSFEQKRSLSALGSGMSAEARFVITFEAPHSWEFSKVGGSGDAALLTALEKGVERSLQERKEQTEAYPTADYDFSSIGEEELGTYRCYVLNLIPKRKEEKLRQGKIWVDSKVFAVIRFEGTLAKLGTMVSSMEILQENIPVDGFWFTNFIHTKSNMLIGGEFISRMENTKYRINRKER